MEKDTFFELLENTKSEILNIDNDVFEYLNPKLLNLNNNILDSINYTLKNNKYYTKEETNTIEKFLEDYYTYSVELNNSKDEAENLSARFKTRLNNLYEYYHDRIASIQNEVYKRMINSTMEEFGDEIRNHQKSREDWVKSREEALNERLSSTESLGNSLEHQLKEQKKRYESIKKKYESVNTNLELEKQEDVFGKIADSHKKNAVWWLFGIILSLGLLICLIFYIKENFCFDIACYSNINLSSYNTICTDCGEHVLWLEIFKSIFFRILIISINIYLVSFCIKNYNASMHNKTINELRQNSFSAALHFYNTTTGDKKDEILLKATDAIFSHRSTGYQGKYSEAQNSFVQNVIDKVTPGK